MNPTEANETPDASEADEKRTVTRRSLLKLGWMAPVVVAVPLSGFTGFHGGNVSADSGDDRGSEYDPRSGGSHDPGSLIDRILEWLADLFNSKHRRKKKKRWGWS